MTSSQLSIEEVRTKLLGAPTIDAVQAVYTVEQSAAALGISVDTFRSRIYDGTLRLRSTGHAYLVPGGLLLDILDVQHHPDINDHRKVIYRNHLYGLRDIGTVFGISYPAAKRLVSSGRLQPDRTRPITLCRGSTLLNYLDGADAPAVPRRSA